MPTIEEIRTANMQRDQLLQVNRALPGRPSVVVMPHPSGLKERARGIAERGHQTHGCFAPADWCPFCELLSITKA